MKKTFIVAFALLCAAGFLVPSLGSAQTLPSQFAGMTTDQIVAVLVSEIQALTAQVSALMAQQTAAPSATPSKVSSDSVSETPETPETPTASGAIPSSSVNLTISSSGFSPSSFTVAAGQMVKITLTSGDDTAHTFAFKDPSLSYVTLGVNAAGPRSIAFTAPSAGDYTFSTESSDDAAGGATGTMHVLGTAVATTTPSALSAPVVTFMSPDSLVIYPGTAAGYVTVYRSFGDDVSWKPVSGMQNVYYSGHGGLVDNRVLEAGYVNTYYKYATVVGGVETNQSKSAVYTSYSVTATSTASVSVRLDPSSPASAYLGMGTTGVTLGTYDFSAYGSNVSLTNVTLNDVFAVSPGGPSDLVNYRLVNASGGAVVGTATEMPNGPNGSIAFNLSGVTVPANTALSLRLVADVNSYPYAQSGGIHNLAVIKIGFTDSGGSQTQAISNVVGNTFTIYRTTLSAKTGASVSPASLASGVVVGQFDFTAGSGYAVTVKNVTLSVAGSVVQSNTSVPVALYDAGTNTQVAVGAITGSGKWSITLLNSGSGAPVSSAGWSIPAGTTRTLKVVVNGVPSNLASAASGTGTFQVFLQGVNWNDGATALISSLSPNIMLPIAGPVITGLSGGGQTNGAPQIVSQSGLPTTIVPGQTVNFAVSAKDPDNDNLSWSVNFGDGLGGSGGCQSPNPKNQQNWTFNTNHSWAKGGQYVVTITASDCNGGTATATYGVSVSPSAQSAITVTAPSAGTTLTSGQQYTVRWTGQSLPSNGTINIEIFNGSSATGPNTTIASGLPITATSYTWTVAPNDGGWGIGMKNGSWIDRLASLLVNRAEAYGQWGNQYVIVVSVNSASGYVSGQSGAFSILSSQASQPSFTVGAQSGQIISATPGQSGILAATIGISRDNAASASGAYLSMLQIDVTNGVSDTSMLGAARLYDGSTQIASAMPAPVCKVSGSPCYLFTPNSPVSAGQAKTYQVKFDSAPFAHGNLSFGLSGAGFKDLNGGGLNSITFGNTIANTVSFAPLAVSVQYGDVNGDGKVNATDASLIQQYAAGSVSFTAAQKTAADVNLDGKIDGQDACIVLNYYVGNVTTLPLSANSYSGCPAVSMNTAGGSFYASMIQAAQSAISQIAAQVQSLLK